MDRGEYQDAQAFAADVRLIFSNCYKYNPPHHDVVSKARRLQVCFELLNLISKEIVELIFFRLSFLFDLILLSTLCTCLPQGVFEKRFVNMPDEPVESVSPTSAVSAKSAGFSGISVNSSANLDKSDPAEERATRLAELQEQVGAEQVGFYTDH